MIQKTHPLLGSSLQADRETQSMLKSLLGHSAAIAFLALVGCAPPDEIQTYTVPKPGEAPQPVAVEQVPNPPDATLRLIVVVIPQTRMSNWFVKFVGPKPRVDALEAELNAFVKSIAVGEGGKITWSNPEGWQVAPPKQFGLATFQNGTGPDLVELTLSEPTGGNIQMNVTRWFERDLKREPVSVAALRNLTSTISVADRKATKYDLHGYLTKK